MAPELVKLMVAEVNVAVPAGPGVEAGMVLLAEVDEPFRRLRIVIGKPEAKAIQAAWNGAIPTRPSTWDLYVSTVALLEGRVERAIITAVEEDRHFFANLELDRSGDRRILACRPSDAIAIALRAYGAELYALPAVLDSAGLTADGNKYGPYEWPEPPEPAPEEPPGDQASSGTAGQPPEGALAPPAPEGPVPLGKKIPGSEPLTAAPVEAAPPRPAPTPTPASADGAAQRAAAKKAATERAAGRRHS